MRLTSDIQADGHELRKARFEEGISLPTNPFLGQLFYLKNEQISKVFYFDGGQWICGVTTLNGKQGDVTITKADVGLSNVDNTSDLDKPISTATQNALSEIAAPANGDGLPTYKTTVVTTTNYQILVTDYLILVAADGLVLNLPSALVAGQGRAFMIKSTSGECTVTSPNGGTIDGTTSASIFNLGSKEFVSDGVDWWITSSYLDRAIYY